MARQNWKKPTKEGPPPNNDPLHQDRMEEYNEQLKDLTPMFRRRDHDLLSGELDLLSLLIARQASCEHPTIDHGDRLNRIYEQRYLRSGRK